MITSAEVIPFSALILVYTIQIYFFIISISSIIFNLKEKVWLRPSPRFDIPVAILLPFYKEECKSVEKTISSILKQNYKRDLLNVIIIIELDDVKTENCARIAYDILTKNGIKCQILKRHEARSSKAAALNDALKYVKEPVVVIYDADDEIDDPYQISKGVSLIMSGYDAVGVKVLRVGNTIAQTLSYIDTFFWVNVSLPGITTISGYPLLSGEGLFVSRKALEIIGGFPDSLTEDSMLTIEFAKHKLKIGLLDSVIYENAPKTLSAVIKQRIRWHRGYAQCLVKTLRSPIPTRLKIIIGMSYTSPISLIVIAFSLFYVFMVIPFSTTLNMPIFPEIFILSIFSIATVASAPLYLITSKAYISRKESFLVLLLYWSLLGLATVYSFIAPKIQWYKTERT